MTTQTDIKTIVFDLDGTLYSNELGLWKEISARITDYVVRVTGVSAETASQLRQKWFQQFGTTLSGLTLDHHVDIEDYLHDVHAVDATPYLSPDAKLNALLTRLPQRKIIFTNGTKEHADNILNIMGIRSHFDLLLGVRDYDMLPKPHARAYETLFRHVNHAPQRILYLEDLRKNLRPAAALRIQTALVNSTPVTGDEDFITHHLPTILDLAHIFPI